MRATTLLLVSLSLSCAAHGGGKDIDGPDPQVCNPADHDQDGDGHDSIACGGSADDCDDREATVHPGADEVVCDGIDQDCDLADARDGDGDGHDCVAQGGDDCDDANAAVNPDKPEVACDGVDQDCDGADWTDVDGDGFDCEAQGGDDCDDGNAAVNPGAADPGVVRETIDREGNAGGQTAIAIDADGDVHVAYLHGGNDDLRYATNEGGAWSIETIDSQGRVGGHPSIALDGDIVHVSYDYAEDDEHVRHASNPGAGWQWEDVAPGLTSAIAIADDGVRIAYDSVVSGYGRASLATQAGLGWSTASLFGSGEDYGMDLAIDAAGASHAAYVQYSYDGGGAGSDGILRHVTDATGAWVMTTVAVLASPRSSPAPVFRLAVDDDGAAHFVYREESGAIGYSTNAGGDWSSERVAAAGNDCAIAIGADGVVHVSYEAGGDLAYARKGAGGWTTSIIDADGDTGHGTSIAVGPGGQAFIAYHDATLGNLRLATIGDGIDDDCDGVADSDVPAGGCPAPDADGDGAPSVECGGDDCDDADPAIGPTISEVGVAIDSVDSDAGEWCSLAVGADGVVHVSYRKDQDLAYAELDGGAWSTRIVVPIAFEDVGYETSIAVDAAGAAHIASADDDYHDWDRSWHPSVRYSTDASGAWVTSVIRWQGGRDVSLALDASGYAHVGLYAGDLYYLTNAWGGWTSEIASEDATNGGASIAVDPDGNAAFAFVGNTWDHDLRAATRAGFWSDVLVDGTGETGHTPSLRIDADGALHVLYTDESNGDLRYATDASGAWASEVVDAGGHTGSRPSLAIGEDGVLRATYYDQDQGDLRYAVREGGAWFRTTLDRDGDVGMYSSVAVDDAGQAHVAYYDRTDDELRYALVTESPDATDQDCDGEAW